MNTSPSPDFEEAILLAEYALKTALVQLSVLDPESIKILQSIPDYKKDINFVLQGIETSCQSLNQAKDVTKRIVCQGMEIAR